MSEKTISFRPIGIIHSEHKLSEETPIQPVYAKECEGYAEIFREYSEGLLDIEGFSHLYIIYHFHQAENVKLLVKPFLQDIEHGVFLTRSPNRPNAIGLSIVELTKREGNILHLKGLDILDGTPLLDIKPYTAKFDRIENTCNGWQDDINEDTAKLHGVRGYKE